MWLYAASMFIQKWPLKLLKTAKYEETYDLAETQTDTSSAFFIDITRLGGSITGIPALL